ncbi:MAG TPA: hypothetical protein VGM26_13285 [Rhizomicrobium sp.]|jgi:hypothetical protein
MVVPHGFWEMAACAATDSRHGKIAMLTKLAIRIFPPSFFYPTRKTSFQGGGKSGKKAGILFDSAAGYRADG